MDAKSIIRFITNASGKDIIYAGKAKPEKDKSPNNAHSARAGVVKGRIKRLPRKEYTGRNPKESIITGRVKTEHKTDVITVPVIYSIIFFLQSPWFLSFFIKSAETKTARVDNTESLNPMLKKLRGIKMSIIPVAR